MAFTTEDRDAVKAAMVQMAVDGVSSVTIDGMTVQAKSMAELERLLELINRDIAAATTLSSGIGRTFHLIPPGAH